MEPDRDGYRMRFRILHIPVPGWLYDWAALNLNPVMARLPGTYMQGKLR